VHVRFAQHRGAPNSALQKEKKKKKKEGRRSKGKGGGGGGLETSHGICVVRFCTVPFCSPSFSRGKKKEKKKKRERRKKKENARGYEGCAPHVRNGVSLLVGKKKKEKRKKGKITTRRSRRCWPPNVLYFSRGEKNKKEWGKECDGRCTKTARNRRELPLLGKRKEGKDREEGRGGGERGEKRENKKKYSRTSPTSLLFSLWSLKSFPFSWGRGRRKSERRREESRRV